MLVTDITRQLSRRDARKRDGRLDVDVPSGCNELGCFNAKSPKGLSDTFPGIPTDHGA